MGLVISLEVRLKRFTVAILLALLPFLVYMRGGVAPVAASGSTQAALHSVHVCGVPARHVAHCAADVVVTSSGSPEAGATPLVGSYGPTQFHVAYNLPCTPKGPIQAQCAAPSSFGGQTIAIVDSYDDPTVESDLAAYDQQFGLPACTRANGCLTVVNENGGTNLPGLDTNWALEISLDVQTAHEVCQTCKILLVEANTSSFDDLAVAENEAVTLGANEISNSYGASDGSWQASYDPAYSHVNVAITAATGDWGYGTYFPASASGVLAVGGTTLRVNADNTYSSEVVWASDGSGCSSYETSPTWQKSQSNWGQTQCSSFRGAADVAADADPNSGAAIYDSTPYGGQTGWFDVGGTSLSSPLIASVIALAGGTAGVANAQSIPYAFFNSSNSHDILSGRDGTCSSTMCIAGVGYDGPTGMGSPNGIAGFGSGSGSPMPTPVGTGTSLPTSTPPPSNTPTPTATATSTATSTPTLTPTPSCTYRGAGKKCH